MVGLEKGSKWRFLRKKEHAADRTSWPVGRKDKGIGREKKLRFSSKQYFWRQNQASFNKFGIESWEEKVVSLSRDPSLFFTFLHLIS